MKKIFIATLLLFATSASIQTGGNQATNLKSFNVEQFDKELKDNPTLQRLAALIEQDPAYANMSEIDKKFMLSYYAGFGDDKLQEFTKYFQAEAAKKEVPTTNHELSETDEINIRLKESPEFKRLVSFLEKDSTYANMSEIDKRAILENYAKMDDYELHTMNTDIQEILIKNKFNESPAFKEHKLLIDTPDNRAVLGVNELRDRLVENSEKSDDWLRNENLKLKLSVINEKSKNSPEFERYQSLLQDFHETLPEGYRVSHSDYIDILHQTTSYNEETLKELNRTLEAQLEDALENKREEDKEGLSDEEYSDDEGR